MLNSKRQKIPPDSDFQADKIEASCERKRTQNLMKILILISLYIFVSVASG